MIQLFPAKVPVKELARGERPRIALQITYTSPPLTKHDFQLQMEDEHLHLMTDFLTISSHKDSCSPSTVLSSTRRVLKTAHERSAAAANTYMLDNLGVVSLLSELEL